MARTADNTACLSTALKAFSKSNLTRNPLPHGVLHGFSTSRCPHTCPPHDAAPPRWAGRRTAGGHCCGPAPWPPAPASETAHWCGLAPAHPGGAAACRAIREGTDRAARRRALPSSPSFIHLHGRCPFTPHWGARSRRPRADSLPHTNPMPRPPTPAGRARSQGKTWAGTSLAAGRAVRPVPVQGRRQHTPLLQANAPQAAVPKLTPLHGRWRLPSPAAGPRAGHPAKEPPQATRARSHGAARRQGDPYKLQGA